MATYQNPNRLKNILEKAQQKHPETAKFKNKRLQ